MATVVTDRDLLYVSIYLHLRWCSISWAGCSTSAAVYTNGTCKEAAVHDQGYRFRERISNAHVNLDVFHDFETSEFAKYLAHRSVRFNNKSWIVQVSSARALITIPSL